MSGKNTDPGKEGPETGNASNPSPQQTDYEPGNQNQLIPKEGEKYLREAGNIEDLPDATDQQEMGKTLKKEQGQSPAL